MRYGLLASWLTFVLLFAVERASGQDINTMLIGFLNNLRANKVSDGSTFLFTGSETGTALTDYPSGDTNFTVARVRAVSAGGSGCEATGIDTPPAFSCGSDAVWVWKSTAAYNGTSDTGFSRGAAGVVQVNNGTVGTLRDVSARQVQVSAVTVGTLQTCNAAAKGTRSFVTDANAAHTAGIGAIVAAGGANNVPVVCDGTNWRIG